MPSMAAAGPDRAASPALPVLVNRSGGSAARLGEGLGAAIRGAFGAAGVAIDLHLLEADDLPEAVARVAGAPVVVLGGGDGTLGRAAATLAGRSALGILPLGTRNHLARDLGIPLDLSDAAAVIAEGARQAIDLGRVRGGEVERAFVNNASIGLYPALVRRRDGQPAPKWLAALPAAAATLARLPHHRLHLTLASTDRTVTTPLLFVGNNRYALSGRRLGTRATIDAGTLSVVAVASRRRLALIGLALRTLTGHVDRASDFEAIGETAELTVSGHAGHLDVALDGDVVRLAMPLAFRSDAGAFDVIVPRAERLSDGGASTRPAA